MVEGDKTAYILILDNLCQSFGENLQQGVFNNLHQLFNNILEVN